jgi:carboxymethylenebutenolidase
MSILDINADRVQVHNDDLVIDAYLAYPKAEGIYSAIVVIQEIFGVNSHIRDVTRRIAQQGYVAIAPAIYQRLAPNFEAGYTSEDIEIGRVYKNQTQGTELLSDIQATINYLYSLPQVKKTGVGTIGFCFGGHVVYLVSRLEDIKVTASFYGAGITTSSPGSAKPTLEVTPQIKGTIYAFFGAEDASIPPEQVKEIEQALEKYQIPHRIFVYPGADHGFFCDQRGSYQPEAAADAWNHLLELFGTL